ncbi:MAG: stage III sporulation protein AE [Defluviitaleaceae bacterium]|nr:stage III sporulation protein AE [Defluviitaleaceae bacterium]
MKKLLISIIIIYILIAQITVYAVADIHNVEFGSMETVIERSGIAFNVNMTSIFRDAVSGELDLSPSGIIDGFLRLFFTEIYQNVALLRNLLIVGIVSAILHNITNSFQNSSIGEIGFYVSYLAMVTMLFSSFRIGAGVFSELMVTITTFIEAGIPLFISLVIMSGNLAGGSVFNTLLMFAVGFVGRFVSWAVGPAIMAAATIHMINFIDERDILTNLSKLIKDIISWTLKILALGLVSLITIQRISTPLVNNLLMRAARSTVNTVPVVGGILTGALENVMYLARAVRGGVLIAVIIAMVSICLMPMLKLGALLITYKLAAALIQPICDDRIVECIEAAADYTALLLSAAAIVSFMFSISIIIMLSF